MLQIAICDDENVIVNQIENIILGVCMSKGIPVDIEAFYCGATLEKAISLGSKYDMIYLDIQMENGDGITVAQKIRMVDENVLLIYVSSYGKYMIELFQLDVFAFILKPIQEKILSDIFLKANHKVCNKIFYFSFRYKAENFKIPCKDIVYFESKGRKVNIYLKNGDVEGFNGKLSEVEARLLGSKIPFVRVHQSFLVNYHLIKSKTKTVVTLYDGTKLPISEDRQRNFSKQYGELLRGEIDV